LSDIPTAAPVLSDMVDRLLQQKPLSFSNMMAILIKKELSEVDLHKILDSIFDVQ